MPRPSSNAATSAGPTLGATAAFTLVELLIGMSLALMVMTAVLTTYTSLARNFTRSLGLSSANQPSLESQARRTLAYFARDTRMTSGLDTTGTAPKVVPRAAGMTLILPGTSSTPKYVTYYFNGTASPVSLSTYTIPAYSLVRIDLSTSTALTLHSSLLTCTFIYYDNSGNAYASSDLTADNYLLGIKQLSLSFTSQAGSATNGTLTQVYSTDSPRVLLRNRSLLP